MRELDVVGVRVDLPSGTPLLLLKETDGPRYVPVWIGAPEASAIVNLLADVETPRPLTHDLFATTLTRLGHSDIRIVISHVTDGVFYADLMVDGETISARTSDAVALALRLGLPVMCADRVIDEVGVEGLDAQTDEVEKFRQFLDEVAPEDFEK